jgi:hypothetical protein
VSSTHIGSKSVYSIRQVPPVEMRKPHKTSCLLQENEAGQISSIMNVKIKVKETTTSHTHVKWFFTAMNECDFHIYNRALRGHLPNEGKHQHPA